MGSKKERSYVEFNEVSFSYPGSPEPVLSEVSFRVSCGEKVSFMGLSGCGKSTVLKLICGLLKPSSGQVKVLGYDLASLEVSELREVCKDLGVALQKGGLFASMRVKDNLCFAMEHMRGWSEEKQSTQALRFLKGVSLSEAIHQYPYQLSGGMRCRVILARALCTDPKLALLDSPTAGLDPISSQQILRMISGLADEGPAGSVMIFTSHVEVGLSFADRVILLNQGQIAEDGAWKEVVGAQKDSWGFEFLTMKFQGYPEDYLRSLGFPESYIKRYCGSDRNFNNQKQSLKKEKIG